MKGISITIGVSAMLAVAPAHALVGGAVGSALIGRLSGNTDTGDGTITASDKATIGFVLGGAAGLLGGIIYGACCSSSWEPVPLTRRQ
jgi:cation transporter-like permease